MQYSKASEVVMKTDKYSVRQVLANINQLDPIHGQVGHYKVSIFPSILSMTIVIQSEKDVKLSGKYLMADAPKRVLDLAAKVVLRAI